MLERRTVTVGHGPELEAICGGAGRPLVWLHGVRHAHAGDPVLQALEERFALFAPVLPGRRSLDELADLPTLHDLVLFYDSAIQALGAERPILAGHGFGAWLAAELAACRPDRSAGLALASPLGLWNDAYPVEDLFARPAAQVDELLWRGARIRPPQPPAEEDPVEAGLMLTHALGGIANYAWPIPDRGLRRRLYRIDAPALLMFAEADALVPPAYATDFAQGLSHARAHALSGSHMAPYEAPGAFADVLSSFAADLG